MSEMNYIPEEQENTTSETNEATPVYGTYEGYPSDGTDTFKKDAALLAGAFGMGYLAKKGVDKVVAKVKEKRGNTTESVKTKKRLKLRLPWEVVQVTTVEVPVKAGENNSTQNPDDSVKS